MKKVENENLDMIFPNKSKLGFGQMNTNFYLF